MFIKGVPNKLLHKEISQQNVHKGNSKQLHIMTTIWMRETEPEWRSMGEWLYCTVKMNPNVTQCANTVLYWTTILYFIILYYWNTRLDWLITFARWGHFSNGRKRWKTDGGNCSTLFPFEKWPQRAQFMSQSSRVRQEYNKIKYNII